MHPPLAEIVRLQQWLVMNDWARKTDRDAVIFPANGVRLDRLHHDLRGHFWPGWHLDDLVLLLRTELQVGAANINAQNIHAASKTSRTAAACCASFVIRRHNAYHIYMTGYGAARIFTGS